VTLQYKVFLPLVCSIFLYAIFLPFPSIFCGKIPISSICLSTELAYFCSVSLSFVSSLLALSTNSNIWIKLALCHLIMCIEFRIAAFIAFSLLLIGSYVH